MAWREKVGNVQGTVLRTFSDIFTFTPANGVPITELRGIFTEPAFAQDLGLESESHGQRPTLGCLLSDLVDAPRRRVDQVTMTSAPLAGRTFEIEDSIEDGSGMTTLVLLELPSQ